MARSSNAAAVRAMWDAWTREGIDAFLEIVPDDVEWRPSSAQGRPLWGSRDVRSFYKAMEARGERVEAQITEIEEIGDEAVLVIGTLRRTGPGGTAVDQMAWLYSFRDGRLWRATAHHDAEEAREAARFASAALAEPAPVLTVDEAEAGDGVTLTLHGELDIATGPLVKAALERHAAPGRAIRIDLRGLAFMDSTGMRSLLEAQRDAEQQGWTLRLGRAPETVQRVFAMSGLEDLLPFDPPAGD